MSKKLSDKYDEYDEGINYLEEWDEFEKNKLIDRKDNKPVHHDSDGGQWEGYLALLGMVAALALFTFLVNSCMEF